jgi:hypothetical protein
VWKLGGGILKAASGTQVNPGLTSGTERKHLAELEYDGAAVRETAD